MSNDGIPGLIETWKIAHSVGINAPKMARLLGDMGLVIQTGKRHQRMVVRDEFAVAAPTLYRMFVDAYKAGRITSRRGTWSREAKRSELPKENIERGG